MQVSGRFKIFFALVILANICVWFYARPLQTQWRNVPSAPSEFSAHAMGLGDYDLAYRSIGLMLQNTGKVDGRTVSLKDYDYKELTEWFFTAYNLQPLSNYGPMLAAFYYGGTSDPQQIEELIRFLRVAGNDPRDDRWRWLVHGIFLARHKAKNMDLAYELANVLKNIDNPDKPAWADMMPAMISNSRGEKEDAYIMLRSMLETSSDTLHPAEVNHIIGYICEEILTPEEAAQDSICDLNKS